LPARRDCLAGCVAITGRPLARPRRPPVVVGRYLRGGGPSA